MSSAAVQEIREHVNSQLNGGVTIVGECFKIFLATGGDTIYFESFSFSRLFRFVSL
jgi:hypothetical protein